LIEIINKQLLLQLVGYLCYWQMGFNSVFKGLSRLICYSVPLGIHVLPEKCHERECCCMFVYVTTTWLQISA